MRDMDERTQKYISGMTDWVRAQASVAWYDRFMKRIQKCGRTAFFKVDDDRIGRGEMYRWYNRRGG